MITKRRLAGLVSASAMIATLTAASGPAAAMAAPKATSLWSVYEINSGVTAYTPKAAPGTSSSVATFAFPAKPTTALLTTAKNANLLGDLKGKTITATFRINGSSDAAFAHGGNQSCGTANSSVRLYFAGDTRGNFTQDTAGYSKYWWSNPSSKPVQISGDTVTLIVPVDTLNWSNWGGQLSNDIPTYFNDAAAHVSEIGLSFGGGCGFANGVGMSAGTASFVLTSYSVQ